MAEHARFFRS